jgi:hypothetical protein
MTTKLAILQPMFALAAWTGGVLFLVAIRRVTATMMAKVSPREYALGESPRVPTSVALANRNYMNLLELPVLFYVGCLVSYATGSTSEFMLALAWLYVGLRAIHTVIHTTYNHVMHRFTVFSASNFTLLAMWVVLGTAVFSGASGA